MNNLPEWPSLRGQAIEMADSLIHAFYEKTLHPKEFGPWLCKDNYSWIGACEGEIYLSIDDALRAYSHQRDMKIVPNIEVGKIKHAVFPITHLVLIVICVVPLTMTTPKTLLQENQRITMVFKKVGDGLKIAHIHTSNPWTLMPDPKVFPVAVSRANYELFHQRLAEEKLTSYPDLSERQKVILELLTQGRTYNTIAQLLNISPRTVRYHVGELLTKFHVATKAELLSQVKRGNSE